MVDFETPTSTRYASQVASCFPRFIARIGAVPASAMESLQAPRSVALAHESMASEDMIVADGVLLANQLFELVPACADGKHRSAILRIRRDVFNARMPRPADVERLPDHARQDVESWVTRYVAHQTGLANFQAAFGEERRAARCALQGLLGASGFREGLLLSTSALYANLQKIRFATTEHWSSRLDQIERGMLRYLTRTTMKATPFSGFCLVVEGRILSSETPTTLPVRIVGDLEDRTSLVRLNKAIFVALWSILRQNPRIRGALRVQQNPTLAETPNDVRFLGIVDGREVFQRIDKHSTTTLILQLVAKGTAERFDDLVARIRSDDRIDATLEQATAFVYGLIELGLLQFEPAVAEQDAEWDKTLIELLGHIEIAHSTREFLRAIRILADEYPSAKIARRSDILSELRTLVSHELGEFAPLVRHRTPVFEDTTAAACVEIDADAALAHAFETLAELAALSARAGAPRAEQATMRHVFDDLYAPDSEIPLLQFYEEYFRRHFKEHLEREADARRVDGKGIDDYDLLNPLHLPEIERLRATGKNLTGVLARRWAADPKAAEISLHASDVRAIMHDFPHATQRRRSVSVFCQIVPPAHRQGRTLIVWKAAQMILGYGKMMSRFLDFLPEDLQEEIVAENRRVPHDIMLAEIAGDAHFNGNFHAPLVPHQIVDPTNSAPTEGGIDTADLIVERDPDDAFALRLRHRATGRIVVPLDLGFLNPRKRPPLFQLLSQFSPLNGGGIHLPDKPFHTTSEVAARVGDASQTNHEPRALGVLRRPRIVYENSVVIGRMRWSFPATAFPRRAAQDDDASYFLGIQRWRAEHGIPTQVYMRMRDIERHSASHLGDAPDRELDDNDDADVTLAASSVNTTADGEMANRPESLEEADRPSRDWDKPQFIDFSSPLLVRLFERYAGDRSEFTTILEEALPSPYELARDSRDHTRALELVLQLELSSWGISSREATPVSSPIAAVHA